MSTNLISSGTTAREKVNLRTPDVMAAVQQQVESHYRSDIVEKVRRAGGTISVHDTTVRLAKQFGFCYGVERAIDLAYAARKVFKDRQLFIVGEIIHNPEVNHQIASLGIRNLTGKNKEADISDLGPDDVVIVPAFGTELSIQQQIKDRGCQIVDTTCGDVMSVWKRVRKYASESATSIIHGKAEHEETKATASRALGLGRGHYLIVLTLKDTDYVCDYIRHGGNKEEFLDCFKDAYSPGFDPDAHLEVVGVANQTTMLRGETEEVQRRIRAAILDRDGPELGSKSFRFFDTICGATQERQDALDRLLQERMDLLLVVGGWKQQGPTVVGMTSTEVYMDRTNQFSSPGPTSVARLENTATLLPDGEVLIAGGIDANSNITSSVEFYSPRQHSFLLIPEAGAPAGPAEGH